jgi:hypothetical protein
VRGRELILRLFQGHLDLLVAREERRDDVAGEDGVVRTRAERGRIRPLVTKNIAKIASASELLTLVYYGMRHGLVRRLDVPRTRPAA